MTAGQVPQSLSWKVEDDPDRVAVKITEMRHRDCKGNNNSLLVCRVSGTVTYFLFYFLKINIFLKILFIYLF